MRMFRLMRCRRRGASLPIRLMLAVAPAAMSPASARPAPASLAASVPGPFSAYVTEAAQRFGLLEDWVWAVMRAESGGDPRAVSAAGAMGLMQIMPGTWNALTTRYGLGRDPYDARANIHAGAAYLREMIDRYGDPAIALAAYNAGPGRVDEWRAARRSLPVETVAYVAKLAPAFGTSNAASSTQPTHPARPTWRASAVFVSRNDGLWGGVRPADEVPPASGQKPSPPVSTVQSVPPADTLFISLSGELRR